MGAKTKKGEKVTRGTGLCVSSVIPAQSQDPYLTQAPNEKELQGALGINRSASRPLVDEEGPSKNIKWEQMKHRNGDQFTEMCN
ncbi:hypothetical protein E5288_WYG016733 [Bos mutus]|uniref:Uncharacterized protein n=1 Tax=Bos mutus TaxID=72004 RepID=A0A6B0R5A5_9CETA|nr:hypothetical protein [Bos mutus]